MNINDRNADAEPKIRIADAARDAACTVDDILAGAAEGDIKLFAALTAFTYTVIGTSVTPHLSLPSGRSSAGFWKMLPANAQEIRTHGACSLKTLPFPDVATLPGPLFMLLESPQTIQIEHVWIAAGHVGEQHATNKLDTDLKLLKRFEALGGRVSQYGKLDGGRRGALADLEREDGRHRNSLREPILRAVRARKFPGAA